MKAPEHVALDARPTPRGYHRLTIGGVRHYALLDGERAACGRPASWADGTIAEVACGTCHVATDRRYGAMFR